MTSNIKEQEIVKRYTDLPEDVQKSLFSSTTSDAIFEVGKKHGLQIDKMGELADETGLVMLGMTKPSEYIRNLEKRLGVPALKAKEIADDINQKVFSPIRESLKKIHGITPAPSPSKTSERSLGRQAPASPIKPPSQTTPNIFLRNIPNEKPKIIPDFIPPPKPVEPTTPQETKNILEKQINDIYREPI